MDAKLKASIDSKSLHELIQANRFAPVGDPRFQGESGTYWLARISELRSKDPEAYTQASKDVGW